MLDVRESASPNRIACNVPADSLGRGGVRVIISAFYCFFLS